MVICIIWLMRICSCPIFTCAFIIISFLSQYVLKKEKIGTKRVKRENNEWRVSFIQVRHTVTMKFPSLFMFVYQVTTDDCLVTDMKHYV